MRQMKKWEVTLKRPMTEYRSVTVLAPTEKLARQRAIKIGNDEEDPITTLGEYDGGEWCDGMIGKVSVDLIKQE